MSITGQVGHVVFGKQSAQGTAVVPGASGAVKITGDSLVSNNNPLTAEGEIGAGRDVTQMVPGGYQAAGALNGNFRARAANILLEGALGQRTAGGGFDTYAPVDDLPLWTVQKRVGSATPEQLVQTFYDVVVNTLNISAPSGALATFSAGIIAAAEARGADTNVWSSRAAETPAATNLVVPAYAATSDDLLVFHGGRIMNGDTGSTVARDETFQSVELAFNNNVAADEYTIRPSRFLRTFTEGIRTVEVNMSMVFSDPDKYSQYTYGLKANNQPGYSLYQGALQIFLGNWQLTNDAQDISGTTLGTTTFTAATPSPVPVNGAQAFQVNIPRLAFTGFPVALSTGRIVVSTSARALKLGANNILTAYVRPNAA